jgi:hypothetical protein
MTDTHQLHSAIDPIILLLLLGSVALVATQRIGLSPIVGGGSPPSRTFARLRDRTGRPRLPKVDINRCAS